VFWGEEKRGGSGRRLSQGNVRMAIGRLDRMFLVERIESKIPTGKKKMQVWGRRHTM